MVVTRDSRAKHFELGLRARVKPGLSLLQRRAGLLERGRGNGHQSIAEHGVVIRLRDLVQQLPTGGRQRVTRRLVAQRSHLLLRANAPA